MSIARDITQAKQWCSDARKILSLVSLSEGDQINMKNRVNDVERHLGNLERLLAKKPQLQKYYDQYKREFLELAGRAHDSQGSKDEVQEVSELLSLLRRKIENEVAHATGDQETIARTEKEIDEKTKAAQGRELARSAEVVRSALRSLQSICPPDTHRLTSQAAESVISTATGGQEFNAAVEALQRQQQSIAGLLKACQEKKKKWTDTAGERSQLIIDNAKISESVAYVVQNRLHASNHAADVLHDYDEALTLLKESADLVKQQSERESTLREKLEHFKSNEDKYELLTSQVEVQLQALAQAFKTYAEGPSKKLPKDAGYSMLGAWGIEFSRANALVQDYRNRANKGYLERWAPYPEDVSAAMKKLASIQAELKPIVESPERLQQQAGDQIKAYNATQEHNAILEEWMREQDQARTNQAALLKALGPFDKQYELLAANESRLAKIKAADVTQKDLKELKEFNVAIDSALKAAQQERAKLVEQANKISAECKEKIGVMFTLQTLFFSSVDKYEAGLGADWKRVKDAYFSSTNVETLKAGIEEMKTIRNRLDALTKNSQEVRACAALYTTIKDLLEKKDLKTYQSAAASELKFAFDKLDEGGTVATEDPSTLKPKLVSLKSKLDTATLDAASIKKLRAEATALEKTLTPLFSQLNEKMAQQAGQAPKDLPEVYRTMLESECRRNLGLASAQEDPVKAQAALDTVKQLQTEINALLKADVGTLKQTYDKTEAKNLAEAVELQKKRTAEKEAYEKRLQEYEKLESQCRDAVGRKFYHSFPFFTDKMKEVFENRKRAEERAKEKDYQGALSYLKMAQAMAEDLISLPDGSKTAKLLQGLDKQWSSDVAKFKQQLEALRKAILDLCRTTNSQQVKQVEDKLSPALQLLIDELNPDSFVKPLQQILAVESANKKKTAEDALQLVRKYLKFVETNPLLRKLPDNPFDGMAVNTKPLFVTLRSLETNLLIVRAQP